MRNFIMTVGVPGSGKSTFIREYVKNSRANNGGWIIASSDDLIEEWAKEAGITYDKMWSPETASKAQSIVDEMVRRAVNEGKSIVWDQTNTSKKVRAKRLKMIPDNYTKYLAYFKTPDPEELKRRLNSRPGKTIPDHVMKQMISNLQEPTIDEGFHGIIHV